MSQPRSRIGEVSPCGNYPFFDKPWSFWIAEKSPNDHKMSEHEKCNVEVLNQTIRHQNADIEKIEQLLELHRGSDADETTQEDMGTLLGTLQWLYIVNDQSKCMIDDYADYSMYSTFLTDSSGSVLFTRSNLLKRKDLRFSCLRLGLIRHRRSLRSSHLFL